MSKSRKYTSIFLIYAWMINLLLYANLIVYFIKPIWAYIVYAKQEDAATSLDILVSLQAGDIVSTQIYKLHIAALIWAIIYLKAVYYIRINSTLWGDIKAVSINPIIKNIVWGYMIPLMSSYIVLMGAYIIATLKYGAYRWVNMALYMLIYLLFIVIISVIEVFRAKRIIRKRKSYPEE